MSQSIISEYGETELVQRISQGDSIAFDLLVSRYSERVYRVALRMLGNPEDAEDVQQEAFVRAYRSMHSFRGDSSFVTWMYSITARLCLTHRKRNAARKSQEISDEFLTFADPDGDPEKCLQAAEHARQVQSVLSKLNPSDRLLIVLKYVEGLTHEEIAPILRCSVVSSRSRLLRAKRLFREQYERMVKEYAEL